MPWQARPTKFIDLKSLLIPPENRFCNGLQQSIQTMAKTIHACHFTMNLVVFFIYFLSLLATEKTLKSLLFVFQNL